MPNFLITYSSEDNAGGVDSAHDRECELYGHNPDLTFLSGFELVQVLGCIRRRGWPRTDTLPNALCFANRLVIVALFSCLACNDERSATDVHPYNQNFVEEERVGNSRRTASTTYHRLLNSSLETGGTTRSKDPSDVSRCSRHVHDLNRSSAGVSLTVHAYDVSLT